jgi:C-terminal processing protease CtpA/Prc
MKKLFILFLLIIIGLSSCKKDAKLSDSQIMDQNARDTLYFVMNEFYFWYKLMPTVAVTDYKDPYTLLEGMRYKTLDIWSFIQTYDEYVAQATGSFVGHGISLSLDPSDQARIAQIYSQSPLYSSGVRRGWIVKKLNGTDLGPILKARDGTAYTNLIGASKAGITNTFLFQTPAGKDTTIISTKKSFTLNTVILADTLHLKSGITGHLVFDQFIPVSNQELQSAFTYFSQNNIKDLIVDLRYNGGGDLSVLRNMASYVAGAGKVNSTFLTLTYNDKYQTENQSIHFVSVSSPLSISRLVVITSRGTASASEDFINGLKPSFNVVTIGDTTFGKPVGMNGFGYPYNSPTYIFWPITFSVVNSDSQGDFYEGIAPARYVDDDVTHDWNSRSEACLKESIYYLEHGNVSARGLYVGKQSSTTVLTEKNAKSNNAYILNK